MRLRVRAGGGGWGGITRQWPRVTAAGYLQLGTEALDLLLGADNFVVPVSLTVSVKAEQDLHGFSVVIFQRDCLEPHHRGLDEPVVSESQI